MKKILLAFLGMLFFAHLSYATYYRIERGDWSGANLAKNYSNTSYNVYEMIDNYVNANFQAYCWEGGGAGTKEDRKTIFCPIGNFEKFGTVKNGGHSTHFWKKARCQAYVDDIYYQNTTKPSCVKVSDGGDGYNVYQIQVPQEDSDGWWWQKRDTTGFVPGAWVHHLRIHEVWDDDYTNYDSDWSGLQRKKVNGAWEWPTGSEWINYKDESDGKTMFTLEGTILTAQKAKEVLDANPLPCLNYVGYPMYDKTMNFKVIKVGRLAAFRKNCPTSLDNKAFVTYFTEAGCERAVERNGDRAMPKGNSGSCKLYTQTRYFTVDPYGNYPTKGDRSSVQERKYRSTYYIFRCKNYYNEWDGTRKDGYCYGYYKYKRYNSNDTFESEEQRGTTDVTTIKSLADGSHGMFSGRVSCTAYNNTHDSNPKSAYVNCKCGSNKFWSKKSCENAYSNSKQYCEENTSAGGICAWEMKSCANYYVRDRVNNKCVGKYYHALKDAKYTAWMDGPYETTDVANAHTQDKKNFYGNSSRVSCSKVANCTTSSEPETCKVECSCATSTHFLSYRACMDYRASKSASDQNSHYCKRNTGVNDLCAWEYVEGKASDTISSCDGKSSKIQKNSNNCTKK